MGSLPILEGEMAIRTSSERVLALILESEDWLDSGTAFGDQADRTGRRLDRHVAIPKAPLPIAALQAGRRFFFELAKLGPLECLSEVLRYLAHFVVKVIPIALELWEGPEFPSKLCGLYPGPVLYPPHEPFSHGNRFRAAVTDSEFQQQVCISHDAKSDGPRLCSDFADFRNRVLAHGDDMIEKACSGARHILQSEPVDPRAPGCADVPIRSHKSRQINRAKVAGVVIHLPVLTARVAAVNCSQRLYRIIPVDSVDERNPRLCRPPGIFDDPFPDFSCRQTDAIVTVRQLLGLYLSARISDFSLPEATPRVA